jgi:hypothetical protein
VHTYAVGGTYALHACVEGYKHITKTVYENMKSIT